jgi:hypothetical protein
MAEIVKGNSADLQVTVSQLPDVTTVVEAVEGEGRVVVLARMETKCILKP